MTPSDLLERLAQTLKREIGPAVADEYPRTQAFLSAVVLQKLAGQLRHADAHAKADADDRQALVGELEGLLASVDAPTALRDAFDAIPDHGDAGLCRFIEALYAARGDLGDARFTILLGCVRKTLRRGLDRRMEYAG